MRRTRVLFGVLLAVLLAAPAPGAVAATKKKPKKECAVVKSPDRGGSPSAVDIHWADVTFAKKTISGVLRVDTTDAEQELERVFGFRWTVTMNVNGRFYNFERRRGMGVSPAYQNSFNGGVAPVMKVSANTFTWTIPRSALADKTIKSCKLTAQTVAMFTNADSASS